MCFFLCSASKREEDTIFYTSKAWSMVKSIHYSPETFVYPVKFLSIIIMEFLLWNLRVECWVQSKKNIYETNCWKYRLLTRTFSCIIWLYWIEIQLSGHAWNVRNQSDQYVRFTMHSTDEWRTESIVVVNAKHSFLQTTLKSFCKKCT